MYAIGMLSPFFSTSSYFSSAAPPRVRQLATLPNRARGVTRLREWYGWPENVSAVSCIVHIVGAPRSEEGNRNYRNKVNQTVGRTRTTTFNIKYLKRTTATRTSPTTTTILCTYQPTGPNSTTFPDTITTLAHGSDTRWAILSPHDVSFWRAGPDVRDPRATARRVRNSTNLLHSRCARTIVKNQKNTREIRARALNSYTTHQTQRGGVHFGARGNNRNVSYETIIIIIICI